MGEASPNWKRTVPRGQSWGGCRVCKHVRPGMTCAAYPDRISLAIASGEVDHLVVRPGQVGETVFELVENPTGLALRFLRNAAARGEPWAIEALAKAEAAGTAPQQKGS